MKQFKTINFLKASLLLMLLLLAPMVTSAKNKTYVYYLFGPLLATEQVTISIDKQDNTYFLIVSISGFKFTEKPVMMIRTFDGDVIQLNGKEVDNDKSTYGALVKGVGWSGTLKVGAARFPVTRKQLSQIRTGIKKIRLSTTPFVHEKAFKKDKIGKKIYKLYQNMQDSGF